MRKTPAMLKWETDHGGARLEEALVAALNEHGSTQRAADQLGLKYETCYLWVQRLGIERRYVASRPVAAR